MTDRIAVFHHGRIAGVLETVRTDQEEIMRYASGYTRSGS
jgi:ribose transport system ATP-binding protein